MTTIKSGDITMTTTKSGDTMTTIKSGDTMTNRTGDKYTVLGMHGTHAVEVKSNKQGDRAMLGCWNSEWREGSYGEPWTHTPARPVINAEDKGIYAGEGGTFARIYDDKDLPEGWDVNKVAAAVAGFLNEVDLDEVTS